MNKKVVAVDIPLVNDYGSSYGTLWLLFAERPRNADDWVRDNLDDEGGRPYYQDRDIWDQCHVEVVTYYDREGNASREAWWTLLEQFATKDIGPSVLKKIARLAK